MYKKDMELTLHTALKFLHLVKKGFVTENSLLLCTLKKEYKRVHYTFVFIVKKICSTVH